MIGSLVPARRRWAAPPAAGRRPPAAIHSPRHCQPGWGSKPIHSGDCGKEVASKREGLCFGPFKQESTWHCRSQKPTSAQNRLHKVICSDEGAVRGGAVPGAQRGGVQWGTGAQEPQCQGQPLPLPTPWLKTHVLPGHCNLQEFFEAVYVDPRCLRRLHLQVNRDAAPTASPWEGGRRTTSFTTPLEVPAALRRVVGGAGAVRVREVQTVERLPGGGGLLVRSVPTPDLPLAASFSTVATLELRAAPGGGGVQVGAAGWGEAGWGAAGSSGRRLCGRRVRGARPASPSPASRAPCSPLEPSEAPLR